MLLLLQAGEMVGELSVLRLLADDADIVTVKHFQMANLRMTLILSVWLT